MKKKEKELDTQKSNKEIEPKKEVKKKAEKVTKKTKEIKAKVEEVKAKKGKWAWNNRSWRKNWSKRETTKSKER